MRTRSVRLVLLALALAGGAHSRGSNALEEALVSGDLALAEKLANEGADLLAPAPADWRRVPRHMIDRLAKAGDVAGVKFLLERGVDPNLRGNAGIPPIIHAITGRCEPCVEALLEAGALPDTSGSEAKGRGLLSGNTTRPISYALSQKMLKSAELLIEACEAGEHPCVALHEHFSPWSHQLTGRSVFRWPEAVELLVKHGASLTSPVNRRPFALIEALHHTDTQTESLRVLLESGSPVLTSVEKGYTVLHQVMIEEELEQELIDNLIAAGMNPDVRAKDGTTPLHLAVHHGRAYPMQMLLKVGASPNRGDSMGNTPLHYAAGATPPGTEDRTYRAEGNARFLAETLLRAGADPDQGNRWGTTPRQIAAKPWGRKAVLEVLEDHPPRR